MDHKNLRWQWIKAGRTFYAEPHPDVTVIIYPAPEGYYWAVHGLWRGKDYLKQSKPRRAAPEAVAHEVEKQYPHIGNR